MSKVSSICPNSSRGALHGSGEDTLIRRERLSLTDLYA